MGREFIKNAVKKVLNAIPCENVILFESLPDLSDNTMPVFEEMLRRGLNKKYKMVWWVNEVTDDLPKFENTSYLDHSTAWNRFLFRWYRYRAKCFICCNRIFEKALDKQKIIYMSHGTTLKSAREYYYLPEYIDYALIASEPSTDVMAYDMRFDKSKIVALGFPRNDVMGHFDIDLHPYFETDFKKIIVWYPTFRQHNKNDGLTNSKNALPILHDTEMAIKLNEIAKSQEVLLVVKPHFVQDVSYIKDFNLSNIVFIDDNFFRKNGLTSYKFVSSCDAMITDYSSIYYDFLLCDKPVAAIWEDIEEYRQNPGFGIDVDEKMKAAYKIYTLPEFEQFLVDVATEHDEYKELRKEICEWANYSTDGKNAKRVVDFIVEKAKL